MKATRFIRMTAAIQELQQILAVTMPQVNIHVLLRGQSGRIPIARQQILAGEQRADVRVVQVFAFVLIVQHDVQQRIQRRARQFHALVVKIQLRERGRRVFICEPHSEAVMAWFEYNGAKKEWQGPTPIGK